MTTIDIMLPYYGDVALMQTAVRSVLAQSDPDWRLTVVDDGREPGVPEWFAALADPRVRYQRNERNLGVTGNFNKCLDLVEADYMVMMGTDDVMLPNYVAEIRRIAGEHPGVGIIQPGVQVIDGAGQVVNTIADQAKARIYLPRFSGTVLMGGEELAASLLRGCWFYFPSLCWRSAAIKKAAFRPDLDIIQDLAIVIDLIEAGETMALSDELAFHYRRHEGSVSSAEAMAGKRFAEARRYFVGAAAQMDALGWPKAAKAARRYTASRLHAVTLFPSALKARSVPGMKNLARHAFLPAPRPGRPGRTPSESKR
ncbi:glycosyltransferase family 2 protein [Catenulispora pinisilvae]|uniref:glycosyltransferase family 2 protein n=1 Tax=Catenulispora pinisilvae TaxID=2705253 RepID=UPI001891AD7E|nr:glycosyltransferase [Catenulispora pinisilvae]